jgi:hypothetical protein
MEELLTLPCCVFYCIVAPLDLKELYHLAPCDMTLLVQYLDQMFGICLSLCRVVPLSAIQHPQVSSSTFLTKIRGRCHEHLLTTVVTPTCMPWFHTSQELGMVQCNDVIASLSLQISSHPSMAKHLSIHGLQPQTVKVGASCLHSSLGITLRLLSCLGYDVPLLRPHQHCLDQI